MGSFTQGVAITFGTRIGTSILAFASSIVIARELGPSSYGAYTLIILVPSILTQLGSLGIELANTYFVANRKYKIDEIASNSLFSALSLGSILILIFWIFLALKSNTVDSSYVWMVVFIIPFLLLYGYYRGILLGEEKIVQYNLVDIFRACLRLICVVFLLVILKTRLFGALLSYVISIIGVACLSTMYVKRLSKIKLSARLKPLKECIKYGVKAHLGNIAQLLNLRLDMFLVAYLLNTTAVGYYSIAVNVAETFWLIPAAVGVVLFPRVSSINKEKADELTPKVCRHTLLHLIILSLILIIIARPFIRFIFGSTYLPSVMPLMLLLPGIVAYGMFKVLSHDLAGRGRPELNTYASFASLGTNIPLNLLLIPKWGISGAAIASTISYILATGIVIFYFFRSTKCKLCDVLFPKINDFHFYYNYLLSILK